MLGSQFLKYFFITLFIMFLSACSNKSSDTVAETPTTTAEEARQEIVDFVNPDKNTSAPTLETYINAEVQGVTEENLDEVNTFISKENITDIETIEELQTFIDALIDKLVMTEEEKTAVKNITQALENNTTLSVEDFTDANISGVTEENLEAVQELLASLDEEKRDTKLEIEALIDVDAPIITILGEVSMQVLHNNAYIDAGATAIDAIDGNVSITSSGEVNSEVLGIYEIIYTALDHAGNKATATRVVRVISLDEVDVQAPTIEIQGSNPFNIALGENYEDAGATAIDNVDKDVTVSSNTKQVNTAILGTYQVFYTVSDSAGNEANASRVVNVIDPNSVDTQKPVITINGNNPIEVLLNSVYEDAGASVSDNVDNDLLVAVTNNVDTSNVNTYTVLYNVTDNSGNKATTQTRSVKVVSQITKDTQKPILILNGSANITLSYKGQYTDEGALFRDNIDSDKSIFSDQSVNTSILGLNILNYNAVDNAGNSADTIVRVVNIVDDEAPVITVLGESSIIIAHGSNYSDQGATASDNYDASVNVSVSGGVTTNTLGTYTLNYNAEDEASNKATTKSRTVVVSDLTPATIVLNGESEYNVSHGSVYIEQGAEATDTIDGVSDAIVFGDTVDTSTLNTYIVRYNYTDNAGNSATEVIRTIHVIDDEKPVIHLNGEADITLLFGQTYTEENAIVSDNVDSNRTITTSDEVNTSDLGTYTLHYDATDSQGNEAVQVIRTVTIGDDEAPVITLNGDEVITITAGDSYIELNATATDNVDASVDVNLTSDSDVVDTRVEVNTTYTVMYGAKDESGNTAYKERTVYIVLNKAPIANAGADQNLTEGAFIDLNASGSFDSDGVIKKYVWREGATPLYEGNNSIYRIEPLDIGLHTLTLIVTDNNHTLEGTEKTDTKSILIRILIGSSNIKRSNDINTSINYDDGYYQSGKEHNYTRNDNTGIVTDNITGLQWQDDINPDPMKGLEAESYCSNLRTGTFSDWRVPTRIELVNIIDYRKGSASPFEPAIDEVFQSNTKSYWSSTVSHVNSDKTWFVDFEYGTQIEFDNNSGSVATPQFGICSVRCVREP